MSEIRVLVVPKYFPSFTLALSTVAEDPVTVGDFRAARPYYSLGTPENSYLAHQPSMGSDFMRTMDHRFERKASASQVSFLGGSVLDNDKDKDEDEEESTKYEDGCDIETECGEEFEERISLHSGDSATIIGKPPRFMFLRSIIRRMRGRCPDCGERLDPLEKAFNHHSMNFKSVDSLPSIESNYPYSSSNSTRKTASLLTLSIPWKLK